MRSSSSANGASSSSEMGGQKICPCPDYFPHISHPTCPVVIKQAGKRTGIARANEESRQSQ